MTKLDKPEDGKTVENLPGGAMSTRPLHFIWIADCSGSMQGAKIHSLNTAIKEAIPEMRTVASGNPNAHVLVRVITFSNGAQWHVSQATPIEKFEWIDLEADGVTDMGKALSMVAEQLKIPPMTDRALPPVLVLISDGQPTDDYAKGLKELQNQPWGKKAVRVAIAIGEDANDEVLEKFKANPEIPLLHANNPDQLVKYIRWVSTTVVKAASTPASQTKTTKSKDINIPLPPPPTDGPDSPLDVW